MLQLFVSHFKSATFIGAETVAARFGANQAPDPMTNCIRASSKGGTRRYIKESPLVDSSSDNEQQPFGARPVGVIYMPLPRPFPLLILSSSSRLCLPMPPREDHPRSHSSKKVHDSSSKPLKRGGVHRQAYEHALTSTAHCP